MENDHHASSEMPRYRCHKEVHALKIMLIEGNTITPADEGYGSFQVSADYIFRHKPVIGGYYVVYADGYQSFSPAAAFEEGYSLIK